MRGPSATCAGCARAKQQWGGGGECRQWPRTRAVLAFGLLLSHWEGRNIPPLAHLGCAGVWAFAALSPRVDGAGPAGAHDAAARLVTATAGCSQEMRHLLPPAPGCPRVPLCRHTSSPVGLHSLRLPSAAVWLRAWCRRAALGVGHRVWMQRRLTTQPLTAVRQARKENAQSVCSAALTALEEGATTGSELNARYTCLSVPSRPGGGCCVFVHLNFLALAVTHGVRRLVTACWAAPPQWGSRPL